MSSTDRRTDGQTDEVNPVYPPSNFVGQGYKNGLQFFRQHFWINFLEWKLLYCELQFTVVCSYRFKWRDVKVGSGNGFTGHYNDVIMSGMASQINSFRIVYSRIYSGADQRKHQSSVSLAFVRGIHQWPVNSPHKGLVTWKMFPFDDVIMIFTINVFSGCEMGSWHEDIMTWKHFPHHWPFVRRIMPVVSPHKETVMWNFDFFLIYAWTNGWTNSGIAIFFFDVCLDKWLTKQWNCQWFEMPWYLCNVIVVDLRK